MLDPLHVVVKEDIAVTLVRIMQKENSAKEFLSTIVIDDVKKIDDQHLTFRGNSFATKASEAYMKLLGDKYLQDTLKEFVEKVLASQDECEVDPSKVPNKELLQQQQQNLVRFVEEAWEKITSSTQNLPFELQEVFSEYRRQLQAIGKEHICDKLISASIFLRFLCPAILSPSLFNLTQEYPEDRARRNLTLIAKTIQTLANFTRFGEKEDFMEFLNQFVDKQQHTMKNFLLQISTPGGGDSINFEGQIDLGKELSILHSLLIDCIPDMNKTEHEEDLEELQQILNDISSSMSQPSVLRQMSSPNFGDKVHNIYCLFGPTTSLPVNPEQSQRKSTINLLETSRKIKEDNTKKNVDLELQSQVCQQIASSSTQSPSQYNILSGRTVNYHKRRRSKDPAEDMNTSDDYVRFEALEKKGSTCDKHSTSTSVHSTSYSETYYSDRRPATKIVDQKVPHIIDSERTLFKGNYQPIDGRDSQKNQQEFSVLTRNMRNSFTHDYDEVTEENDYHMKSGSQNSLCKVANMGSSGYPSVRNSQTIPSSGLLHAHMTLSSNGHYSFRPPLAFKNPMYSLNISHGSISDSEYSDGPTEERKSNGNSLRRRSGITSISNAELHTQLRSPSRYSRLPQLSYFHSYPQLWKSHRLERRGSADQLSQSPKKEGVQKLVCYPFHHSSSFETKRHRTLEEYHVEVETLKELMTDLQRKLTEAEKKLSKPETHDNRNATSRQTRLSEEERQQRISQQRHKDERFQSIITRLIRVEEELRHEHQEMRGIIANRQKVIDAQERRIQLLDAANLELTSALEQLQKQYTSNIWSHHSCEDLLTENTKLSFRSSSC
ncbi:ras GTPase-activating protein nGAP-like isoform X2 [Limulus polyphemus]|uniref:Ras GTPase-activating protein nGAP-like isoform X2 n=1 Tax=Limulus polyphemus TaxID=6850 RepID=A0ABM1TKB4_LIMPO|nr:ras GTPase-activating protein nGAP-like isoform X2 [Limulus polyphemus]